MLNFLLKLSLFIQMTKMTVLDQSGHLNVYALWLDALRHFTNSVHQH